MPKTKEFIKSVLETEKEFRQRRVLNVLDEIQNEEVIIKEWKILRRAGIRKEYYNEVCDVIKNILQNNNHGWGTRGKTWVPI